MGSSQYSLFVGQSILIQGDDLLVELPGKGVIFLADANIHIS